MRYNIMVIKAFIYLFSFPVEEDEVGYLSTFLLLLNFFGLYCQEFTHTDRLLAASEIFGDF